MNPTEHTANTVFRTKTGLSATLLAFLRGQGRGAPLAPLRVAPALLLTILAVLALTAAPAVAAAPKVISESASAKATEARLESLVNPENEVTECRFQYGTTTVTENEVQCESPTIEGGEQGVAMSVTGLQAGTTYRYRVVLENLAKEKATGAENQFKTTLPPEEPETKGATAVQGRTADLHGILNPKSKRESEPGSYRFLYRALPAGEVSGECQGEGQQETPLKAAAGHEAESVSEAVTGLLPGTTYGVTSFQVTG